jgi:hypothetical protein
LVFGERLVVFAWRHDVVFVGSGDAFDEGAFFEIAGDDGVFAGFEFLEGVFFAIETEAGFAFALVGTVAGVAMFGEEGADFAIEIDWCCGRLAGAIQHQNNPQSPTIPKRRAGRHLRQITKLPTPINSDCTPPCF